ncbi:MAG: hypothetical protein HY062_01275 [Bacteroidetes bacterium]|nr:hypothetical protein [Bacteroidota bacterium]
MSKKTLRELEKIKKTLIKSITEKLNEVGKMDKELHKVNEMINSYYESEDGKSPLGRSKVILKSSVDGLLKSDIPTVYANNMVLRKKILFIINKNKSCTVKEIAEEIVKAENDKSYDSVYPMIQQAIRKLINQKHLNKIGDYNSKYELNLSK